VRPLLPYDADKFLPESVPAFAATEIMNLLHKKYLGDGHRQRLPQRGRARR
jgi:hypothetical protein